MRTVIFLLASTALLAQDVTLLKHTFDEDTQGWVVMGQGGSVRVTREPAQVKAGSGALAFTYDLDKSFTAAVAPTPSGLAGMRRLRFWAKCDHDTPLIVLLSEKKPGGGNYSAWIWAPANTWQHIELAPEDFAAGDGPTDPVDADGKLDLDQVEGIGIIDLAYMFNQIPNGADSPLIITKSTGSHTILLDDLEVLKTGSKRSPNTIDAFDRGFSQWMTLGGINLKLDGKSLQASYERSATQLAVLARRAAEFDLTKATHLALDLSSEREATIAISIELKKPGEAQGPRYAATVYPRPGREPLHVDLKFTDFEHDDTSISGPPKIDPSKIKTISIIDLTAMAGGDTGKNTIWIGPISAN